MSELFDSLRRGRQSPSSRKFPRTAQGDAVLATLGYAPGPSPGRGRSTAMRVLLIVGALALCWMGWNIYAGRKAPSPPPGPAPSSHGAPTHGAGPAPRTAVLPLLPLP